MIPSLQRPATRTGLALTFLGAAGLLFYHGLWVPDLVLIKRDAFRYFLPLKQYLVDRLSAGELPHWFPYEALGCPFIGISGIGLFHPFTTLYFLFSVPDAYRASTLLSCLLAAIGAFTLGRLLGLSRSGAVLAGTAFALSGYVVSLTDNILYLYPICALPLFCAALEQASRRSRGWCVTPAVIWTTVFLHGDVQTGYYYGFIALLWMGLRAPASYREAGIRLVLTTGLTLLLSGVQLAPLAALYLDSDRSYPELFREQALHWSMHPLRLWTLIAAPNLDMMNPTDVGNVFFGATPPAGAAGGLWAESLYLGMPVAGLAFLGAWHRRDLRVLTLLASFALLLSLGRFGHLYGWFYQTVPFWSAFRYPEKLMGVFAFAMALLAGAGLDQLRARQGWPMLWLTAAVLCAASGFGLRTDAASSWTAATFNAPSALAHDAAAAMGIALFISAAVALGMWAIAAGFRTGGLRPGLLLTGLLALVTLDLTWANLRAYHTGPAEAARFVPPFAEAIAARERKPSMGRFRLFSIPEEKVVAPEGLVNLVGGEGAASVAHRLALDLEHNAQFQLEAFNVYIASRTSAFRNILKVKLGVAGVARYNVAYYTGRRARAKDPQFANTAIAELPEFGLALFQSSVPVKPRAYLSFQPEQSQASPDPAALIARPEFQNGTLDVVESVSPLPGPSAGGEAAIVHYRPEEVQVQVTSDRPAVLILLDAFDKGWQATLESGDTLPIMRANLLVRAVIVPGGAHLVTFRYRTPYLWEGAIASLAGVLLCLGLAFHGRQDRHRHPAAP